MPSSRLSRLAAAIDDCRRCPLYRNATQGVAGEGKLKAGMMLVGEQPGDKEDRAGKPFVGPAGMMLDRAIAEAGLVREQVFITNAVKHFKNEPRGKRRIHKKPNTSEIDACRWWLDQEMALVDPAVIVALGATAARAIWGGPSPSVRLAASRSKPRPAPPCSSPSIRLSCCACAMKIRAMRNSAPSWPT